MKGFLKVVIFIFSFVLSASSLYAEERGNETFAGDKRGKSDITVCQQNLENYSIPDEMQKRLGKKYSLEFLYKKEGSLVRRFSHEGCDVIAFQELVGSEQNARDAIRRLAYLLAKNTGRTFEFHLGKSNDKTSRVGFLVAKDRAEVLNTVSYANVELPKLMFEERPRYFTRGPFEIQLKVRNRDGREAKRINLITFHFKSKARGFKDPAKTDWEILRMQSSEALRKIVENRFKDTLVSGEQIVILLGDRNADYTSASARILEGSHTLSMFEEDAPCRLSKKGEPICKAGTTVPPKFVSVLTNDPETRLQYGTYFYKKSFSWLDDILLPTPSLPFAWANYAIEGNYDSGVYRGYPEASDHALAYIKLNF